MQPATALVSDAIVVREDASTACAQYVASHPRATAYHRPEWLHVLQRACGHTGKYFIAERRGRVVGVLPVMFFRSRLFGKFAVSLPFVNYGGVLADDASAEAALLDQAIAQTAAAGGKYLELRHSSQHFTNLTPKRHKVAMELRLERSADDQWQSLDRKLRNQVRKAEKSEVEIRDGGAELLAQFHHVFAVNMRDLGTPVYGVGFFREILAAFPDSSRIFVAEHRGQPIAASFVHWYRDRIEVPWASSIREFNSLCANVLVYWHMLRFGIDRGLHTFDFGRSTPGEGTYLFKKQWGAEPHDLVWEYWTAPGHPVPDLSPKNPTFALAIRTWQRLPVRVATAVGPLIVRNIP